jgi:hypothetical protein
MLKRIISKVFTLSLIEAIVLLLFLIPVVKGVRPLPSISHLISVWVVLKISVAVLAELMASGHHGYAMRAIFYWGEVFSWPAKLAVWLGSVSIALAILWAIQPMKRALGLFPMFAITVAALVITITIFAFLTARYGLKNNLLTSEIPGLSGWDHGWRKRLVIWFSRRRKKP